MLQSLPGSHLSLFLDFSQISRCVFNGADVESRPVQRFHFGADHHKIDDTELSHIRVYVRCDGHCTLSLSRCDDLLLDFSSNAW